MTNGWDFFFALPSLPIDKALDSQYISIVPFKDERLQRAISNRATEERFVNSFISRSGKKLFPSALIVAKDAPGKVRTTEALTAYRNMVAISILLRHWSEVSSDWRPDMLYSDHFDFYPLTVNENGRIVALTPDLNLGSSENAPFVGMPSPYLALSSGPFRVDQTISTTLYRAWTKRFISPGSDSKYTRTLFRSLEVAYQALSIPIKNQSSLHDHGTLVSNWVSAFEILVYLQNNGSHEQLVLDQLLNDYPLQDPRLRARRFTSRLGKKQKPHRVNIVKKLYHLLYTARNDFLHGNPIKGTCLHPFGVSKPPITYYAPVIYRIALWSFLKPYLYRRLAVNQEYNWIAYFASYEDCLLRCLTS